MQAAHTDDSDADDNNSDALCLEQVALGGPPAERAAKLLFKRHYRRLRVAMTEKFRLDTSVTEDLIQETFLRAFKAAAGFRKQAKVFTWLYQIAYRLHLDHTARPVVEQTVEEAHWDVLEALHASHDEPHAGPRAEAFAQCFDQRFELFTQEFPKHAEALRQVYFGQQSLRELAAALGRTEGAVRTYMLECRKKLRQFSEICLPLLN